MMVNPKNTLQVEKKQKSLYLIFYIILAFIFIILIIDLIVYLLISGMKPKLNPININIQGISTQLQQEINNLIK